MLLYVMRVLSLWAIFHSAQKAWGPDAAVVITLSLALVAFLGIAPRKPSA